jgi:hypothetical protein
MRRRLTPSTLPAFPPVSPHAVYVAWYRRSGEAWAKVAGGATLREASDRCHDRTRPLGPGDYEQVTLKNGESP